MAIKKDGEDLHGQTLALDGARLTNCDLTDTRIESMRDAQLTGSPDCSRAAVDRGAALWPGG